MDDAWNNSNGKWDQLIEPNLGSNTQLIETMYMRKIVGNIDGPNDKLSVWSIWLFECDDQQAVKESHENDWKYYKEGGCTGIDIHQMNGGDYASNGTYMFVARFNSMEQLGGCMDHMWNKSDYMKSSADYHSKIKIIKKAYYKLNLRKNSLTMKRGFKHKIKLAYKKYLIKGIKDRNNKISRHFAERLILNKNFEAWKKLNNSKKSYYEYLGDVYGE